MSEAAAFPEPLEALPVAAAAAPVRPRLHVWSVVIAKFLGIQAIVQVLSFFVGLLVVRTLTKQEYALFTVAGALQGTMSMLADLGLETALSSIGGRVWHDRERFSRLIAAAFQARRVLVWISIGVSSPILFFLLRSVGAGVPQALLIVALVAVGVVIQVRATILLSVPRFLAQVRFLQRYDLVLTALRLLAFQGAALWALNCAGCVGLNVVFFAGGLYWLQRHCRPLVDLSAPPAPEDLREISSSVRALAANVVFYCFQGQIAVWLISAFGSASATAEVGALGRIGVLYTIVGSLMSSVLLPSFAKAQDFRGALHKYLLIFGGFCGLGAVLTLAAWLYPDPLLWILGPKYAHLRQEFFLITLSSSLAAAFGSLWMMNTSRAWVRHAWLYIPSTLLTQAILSRYLDFGTVRGVLLFGLFSQLPVLFLNLFLSWNGFQALRRNSEAATAALPSNA